MARKGTINVYLYPGDEEIGFDVHYIANRGGEVEITRAVPHVVGQGIEMTGDDFITAYAKERGLARATDAEVILADRCYEDASERAWDDYEDHCEREMDARRER